MSSLGLLRELSSLCAEIRSEKLTTRNKAADRLDNILTNSKSDLLALFRNKENLNDFSWMDLFNSAIHAALKHAAKLEESKDSRSNQAMRNKNHVYTAIVTKLIDYSLEDHNNFLSKSTLLSAFFDGFSIRSALKSFGTLFLYVLDTGIYKSEDNVDELKVNEFSRILSYLFEINTENDENLRFAVLRTTNRTIELSERNVQLGADLIDYLPEVKVYASIAGDDRRKAEVIKLFHLFISQLSLDYHTSVCTNVQEVLPIICGFYNFRMRTEVKETFFSAVVISLTAIYPHLKSSHCNPINPTLSQHWNKTLKKIETIMEIEIKERQTQLYRYGDVVTKRCFVVFIEMSALIVYLTYFYNKSNVEDPEDSMESKRKLLKMTDNMEIILGFVQTQVATFNETWFAIFAELLNSHHALINSDNYQQVLETIFQILCVFANADNLKNLKLCILSVLRYEKDLKKKNISTYFCDQIWTKIVEFVLTDTSSKSDVINEKQLIIQSLIIHKKLSLKEINTLLQSFLINKTMRRTECIVTVRQILLNADCLGLDKTSDLVGCVLNWICEPNGKIDAKSILFNIEPIDFDLIADTIAIAVINFLTESEHFKGSKIEGHDSHNLMLLLYKYNRKYICIEEHGSEMRFLHGMGHKNCDNEIKNCLFQNNYELIMRQLNFSTTKETSPSDILLDLSHLQKLVCLMDRLFKYKVFSKDNYSQCPLIKRIGFFLSHLEFQLKNNDPKCIDRSDVLDILHRIKSCFLKFTSNTTFLNYLEAQPLEELISFVGKTLIFSVSRNTCNEFEDFGSITCLCLHILAMLCGSNSHYKDAFVHIRKHKFTFKADFNTLIVLIKIFCTQTQEYPEVAAWFVDKLKTVCQLYHNNKEISTSIVALLPAIFKYVKDQDEPLQDMLIILSSLLKKTYKKSYSTGFGAKLMESVRLISRNCAQNSIQSDFKNICMSVTKFIYSSSLEVQFAAINAITAFMDFKWFCAASEPSELHLDFCEELMTQIDSMNLVTTTLDNNLNSISVTTQFLVAVFVFSSYHQEKALQKLSYFCALSKLNESNFFDLTQIAAYFECTLSELTNPYVSNLVHKWTEKKYPISKLPYFLCSNKKETFYLENISIITTCVLLHYKVSALKHLEKYKTQSELIELAIPSLLALTISFKSGCLKADKSSPPNYIENLIMNLNLVGVDLFSKTRKSSINWNTIFNILELYSDVCHFKNIFGFSLCSIQNKWYNIDYESLLNCLRYYINNYGMIVEKSSCSMFSLLISKHSIILVRVFTALKEKTCKSIFLIDKLKSFHLYCTFSKLIMDSIEWDTANISTAQSSKKYFIRDVIYYLLYIIQDATGSPMLQCAALIFLQQILSLPVVSEGFCCEIVKSHLNYIIKVLVASAKINTHQKVRESSINTVYLVINYCKEQHNEAIALLGELPMGNNSDKFSHIQKPKLFGDAKDLETIMKTFLETQNRGTECLIATRNYIAKNKLQLPLKNALIYDFIKRLIEVTCNSANATFSMEAAKCLGEIGPLKINGFSYYFETDASFYHTEAVLQNPMEYFTKCLLNAVENILLNYNKKTIATVCLVCEQLVNCKNGIKLLNPLSYLNVFRTESQHKSYLNSFITNECIDVLTILKNNVRLSYDQWICIFVSKLYAFFGWNDFEELCCHDTSFAESSLIPLFKILVSQKDVHLDNILAMLDYFFNQVFTAINENPIKFVTIYREKRIIKHFLDICECVRISNEWNLPKVNLLYVAKACNYCQAYFLAILFLEMWAEQQRNMESEKTNDDIMSNELFQEASLKAYESIGCCDAISGFLNPINSRLEFLNIEGTWSDVLLHADATGINCNSVYVNNLKNNGLLSLANLNQNTKSIDYEICWRLCQWDTIVEGHSKINTLNDMEQEFKKHHFNSLKCIYKREEINCLAAITNARNCVVSILKEISLECLQSVYKYLTWLQLLQQVEDFCQVQFTSSTEVETIFEKWKIEDEVEYGNFFCKEQILSHRATLFKTAGIRANRKVKEYFQDDDPLEHCLLQCIKNCICAGEINLASRNIAVLKNMNLSNEHIQVSVLLEDAKVCLKKGKSFITKAILEHVIKKKEFAFCLQRVEAYRMYGEYLMESNTETLETVLNKFFKGSIELLNHFDKNKEKILLKNPHLFKNESFLEFEQKNSKRAYQSMAKYADREYTQLNMYSNSDEFQMKSRIIQENRQAADSVGKQNKDRDKNIGAIFMKKFANLDEKEILSVKQKRTDNLCIAIECYIKFCLIDQVITSPAIYRIIALWFANKQNEYLHSKIANDIGAIPSYKFISALSQMTARLNSKNQDFLLLLRDILVRCAQDHPNHALYQLFPLVNAFSDSNNSTSNDRVSIAKDIINRSKNKSNSLCIKQLETMFPALIDFANETADNKSSISEKLRRMKNLDAIQCPTIELPVSISKAYNITSVVKWEDKVVLVGGINAPKKVICLCSDGIKRSQLLKAKDDLRQDAVMQQVFSMINDLLSSETETNLRKLKLRTYKVVPLSMRSGILEWCQNTIPIGVYLSGDTKSGAHKKYRPNDYTIQKCRKLSNDHLKSDAKMRLQIYLHICSNIQPVFHYFFFEKFLVPGEWFERRLAYINSVATTSIVGFVLGLGDRHTQNILIDEKTAEVIHIDFGIAFEQGQIMPTPETVPFRLTRDMVAPMGVCETNGLFKKSCEAMMRTLRRSQAVITTILEVLLYDPLYIWKVVPQAVDNCASEQTNLTAQRAILCVQNKLEGKQAGIFGVLEIDVQVQRLINDAMLSQNLCLLYPGWDPYL